MNLKKIKQDFIDDSEKLLAAEMFVTRGVVRSQQMIG